MLMTFRRRLATFFLSVFKLGGLIQKLYPIAIDLEYLTLTREKLDLVRDLLVVDMQSDLIRVGDEFNGGYAISSIIDPNTNCISVGVGTNVSFDIDISKRLSSVHLYDHTVSKLPVQVPQNVVFFKKGLARTPSDMFLTLEEIIDQFPSNSPLILKMDIEGCEWEILENISSATLLRFDQIVLELHHFHQLNDTEFFEVVVKSLNNLKATHQIINRHANNWARFSLIHGVPVPDVLEVTYVRRVVELSQSSDSFVQMGEYSSFANFPCNPNRPDIALNF